MTPKDIAIYGWTIILLFSIIFWIYNKRIITQVRRRIELLDQRSESKWQLWRNTIKYVRGCKTVIIPARIKDDPETVDKILKSESESVVHQLTTQMLADHFFRINIAKGNGINDNDEYTIYCSIIACKPMEHSESNLSGS